MTERTPKLERESRDAEVTSAETNATTPAASRQRILAPCNAWPARMFSLAQTSRGQCTYAIRIRHDPRGRALPQACTANDVHSLTSEIMLCRSERYCSSL